MLRDRRAGTTNESSYFPYLSLVRASNSTRHGSRAGCSFYVHLHFVYRNSDITIASRVIGSDATSIIFAVFANPITTSSKTRIP